MIKYIIVIALVLSACLEEEFPVVEDGVMMVVASGQEFAREPINVDLAFQQISDTRPPFTAPESCTALWACNCHLVSEEQLLEERIHGSEPFGDERREVWSCCTGVDFRVYANRGEEPDVLVLRTDYRQPTQPNIWPDFGYGLYIWTGKPREGLPEIYPMCEEAIDQYEWVQNRIPWAFNMTEPFWDVSVSEPVRPPSVVCSDSLLDAEVCVSQVEDGEAPELGVCWTEQDACDNGTWFSLLTLLDHPQLLHDYRSEVWPLRAYERARQGHHDIACSEIPSSVALAPADLISFPDIGTPPTLLYELCDEDNPGFYNTAFNR